MAKVKIIRKIDDKDTELEVEESEIVETDVRVPATTPEQKLEKTLTQAEVNKLMADQRRQHKIEIDKLSGEYAAFRKEIEDREKAANDAAAEKVADLRKDLPESIGKLLDKLTPIEQLEWLSDPANLTIKKQDIPQLPEGDQSNHGKPRRNLTIV